MLKRGDLLVGIFDSLQDGLAVLDNEFRILAVNRTMEKWYSQSMPLVGKKCYQALQGASEVCEVCPARETFKTGAAAGAVIPQKRVEGENVAWLDVRSFPLIDPSTEHMQGVIECLRDVTERQRAEEVMTRQAQKIRELSTPVLQVREGLLILPIIGLIDTQRARQLTERLLRAIRANRAKVVVIDITGVPGIDSKVANHLLQTVEACRLMGAEAIVTGLSSEIAQTIVAIGVDLSKVKTVNDLQGGIDEADRLLGYRVITGQQQAAQVQ
jgi:anti-anti-sigma factor